MADPKYADLPGIARDEPDVYESNDLPESEQVREEDIYDDPRTEEEPVEKIHLTTEEAYQKFKGKHLTAERVDFSERIGRKIRTGYGSGGGGLWELRPEDETPLNKFNRLQCELRELLEEVNELNKNPQKNDGTDVSTSQVQNALDLLHSLKLNQDFAAKSVDPQGDQIKKLISQVEHLKSSSRDSKTQKVDQLDGITYQLNVRPEKANLSRSARLADIDSRLNRLENILGTPGDTLTRLSAANSKGTLYETAEHLCATITLLDPVKLDHIEGRLMAVNQKLENIAEKKRQTQVDSEKDKMILELYDLVKGSEQAVHLLPKTIQRLQTLEELHKKAADFAKTLKQMEAAQEEINSNLENNKILLEGVQESFATNLNEINGTVQSLDARIKNLKK